MQTSSPTIDRRRFLQMAGGVAAGIALTGSLEGCAGVRRGDLSPVTAGRDLPPLVSHGASILDYASLAPSSHNTQPWSLRVVEAGHWRITVDPARRLPGIDAAGRESVVSLGAFLENLDRAAASFGHEVETTVTGETTAALVVDIRLHTATPSGADLSPLKRRRTVKSGLGERAIAAADLAALRAAWPGHVEFMAHDSAHGRSMAELTVASMQEQMSRPTAREEFADWVRLNRDDAERRRDGLTTESMEITGLAGWWVRTFMDREDIASESFGAKTVDATARQTREGAGWLLLRSDGETPADWLAAGRGFQRLGLIAATRRIGLHPMSQVLEEESGRTGMTECFGQDHHAQMLVRVGYPDSYRDPVSLRRPASWFIRG